MSVTRVSKMALAAALMGAASALPNNYLPASNEDQYAPVPALSYSKVAPYSVPSGPQATGTGFPTGTGLPHGTGFPYGTGYPHGTGYLTGTGAAPTATPDVSTYTETITLTTVVPCKPYVTNGVTSSSTASEIITEQVRYETILPTPTSQASAGEATALPEVAPTDTLPEGEDEAPTTESLVPSIATPEPLVPSITATPESLVPSITATPESLVPSITATPEPLVPSITAAEPLVPTSAAECVPETVYITVTVPGYEAAPVATPSAETPDHIYRCTPGTICYDGSNWNGTDATPNYYPSGTGTGILRPTGIYPTGGFSAGTGVYTVPVAAYTPAPTAPSYNYRL